VDERAFEDERGGMIAGRRLSPVLFPFADRVGPFPRQIGKFAQGSLNIWTVDLLRGLLSLQSI
jgi:hypothetical protein